MCACPVSSRPQAVSLRHRGLTDVYVHRAGDAAGGGPALAEHKVLFAGKPWPWLLGLVLWPGYGSPCVSGDRSVPSILISPL